MSYSISRHLLSKHLQQLHGQGSSIHRGVRVWTVAQSSTRSSSQETFLITPDSATQVQTGGPGKLQSWLMQRISKNRGTQTSALMRRHWLKLSEPYSWQHQATKLNWFLVTTLETLIKTTTFMIHNGVHSTHQSSRTLQQRHNNSVMAHRHGGNRRTIPAMAQTRP